MVVEWTLCAGSGTVYLSLSAFWCLSSLVADFSPFDKVPAPRCHCFHFKGKKKGSEKLFQIIWQFPPCCLWEDFFATSLWLGSWRRGGQGLGRDSAREPLTQADVCVFAIFHPRFLTAASKDGIINFVNQSPAVLDNSMRNMAAENVSYKMLTLGKLNERYTETLCPWQLFCKYHAYCCFVVSLCEPLDLCPRDFPGKYTGVDHHFLLQRIFPAQGLNLHLLNLQVASLVLSHQGSPNLTLFQNKNILNVQKAYICH